MQSKKITRFLCLVLSLIMAVSFLSAPSMAAWAGFQGLESAEAIEAPSKDMQMCFWLDEEGTPYYSLTSRDLYLIESSPLGMNLSIGDLRDGFALKEIQESSGDTQWTPVVGEKEIIIDKYNEAIFVLEHSSGMEISIQARVYDTGAAFRYLLPSGDYTVYSEHSQFTIPEGSVAQVHMGGNQTIPRQVSVGSFSGIYRSPMTVQYPNGTAMTMCESGGGNYPPLRFSAVAGNALKAVYGYGSDTAAVQDSDPAETPWRTFVVGDTLEELPENADIILNLNEEPEGDFSWVVPGKNIMTDGGNTTESMKVWIDCAKEQNYQYVLIDTGWYGPEWDERCDPRLDPSALNDGSELSELLKQYIVADGHFKHPGFPMYGRLEESGSMAPDLNMPEICAYAKSQGVGIILYVEDRALFDTMGRFTVDELFTRFESWGVSGVKPGFVQYQTQEHQRRMTEMIQSAADHKLILTVHDEYVQTGTERTYPNLLTTEGILGDEGIKGDQIAEDIAVLFTRLIQGPADHTFCFPGKGTKGYALASPILFRTGLQSLFWYGNPNSVAACDQDEIKLWRDLSGNWDELNVLEASMYEYASYARRSGNDWFIGSLSAIDRDLILPLDFLNQGKYKAEIYADPIGIDGTIPGGISTTTGTEKATTPMRLDTFIVDNEIELMWVMKYGTGYSVKLSPATAGDIDLYEEYTAFPIKIRIEEAASYDESLYTVATWKTLSDALEAGKALLKEGSNPTKGQIQQAADAIKQAILGLRSVEHVLTAIAKAAYLAENHYTVASWAPVAEALAHAKDVIGREVVSQAELDEAAENLEKALAGLVKKNMEVGATTYLDELDYLPYSNTAWGSIGKNRSYENPQIQLYVGGVLTTFAHGMGVHARGNLYYDIEGMGFEVFEAYVGINAIKPVQGDVIFRVYGDGNLLYESQPSGTGSQNAQFISVSVANVKELWLEVDENGSDNGDHADWADAKLLTMKEMDNATTISGISVNGTAIPEFMPGKFEYTLPVAKGAPVPAIDVSVPNDDVQYTLELPSRVPGKAVITVKRAEEDLQYTIWFLETTTVYTSDITPDATSKMGSDYGAMYKDISQDGLPMSVTGADGDEMNFAKGIGMHANYSATYNIAGKGYERFQTWVGASHWKVYPTNSMNFLVYLNGSDTPAYESGTMSYLQPAKFIDLDLSGVHTITLVLDMIDRDNGDHGNWADAKFLTYVPYEPVPEDTNKKILGAVIEYAKKQDTSRLNGLVLAKYKAALEKAEKVFEDIYATQAEVDKAADDLLEMVHMLLFTANPEELQGLVELAETFEAELECYKDGAVKDEFIAALEDARNTLEDPYSLDQDFERAYECLWNALEELKKELKPIVDKKQLEDMIARSERIAENRTNYLDTGWNAFMEELRKAQDVLRDSDDQKEIDEATMALYGTILDLRLKPNKDLLSSLLNRGYGINARLYTERSIQPLNKALKDGQEIYDNPQAEQGAVTQASKNIQTALQQLESLRVSKTAASKTGIDSNGEVKTVSSPKTGESDGIYMVFLLAGISVVGITFAKKKKH